jgi:hypothetical protein
LSPAIRIARLATRLAAIAFHPTFVAIATRPSFGMECAHYDFDLGSPSSDFLKNRILVDAAIPNAFIRLIKLAFRRMLVVSATGTGK